MNVVARSVLVLWMCTFTLVGAVKDCTKDDLEKKIGETRGFLTSQLKDSYDDKAVVRVPCDTGYEGFYRATCKDGVWSTRAHVTRCEPKSCGHPEDSANADFSLIEDATDFVFGSTVKYECQKGYVMVSRTSTRSCLDQGWSNTVPVCEAIQCPMMEVDDNINVYGDYAEATFGNVINFQCKSDDMIIHGSSVMDCGEHGNWIGNKPTCKAIECGTPNIRNGVANPNTGIYKKNDILPYSCEHLYTKAPASKHPRCIKKGISTAGWNPTPECELITCELPLTQPPQGTTYDPSRARFYPGETVNVACAGWFWSTRHTSVKCQDDGTWNFPIHCEAVYCHKPNGQNIDAQDRRWNGGDLISFTCKRGYKQTSQERSRCTVNGWTPEPHCKEITCELPVPPRGTKYSPQKKKYVLSDMLEVGCEKDYSFNNPGSNNPSRRVQCTFSGKWDHEPLPHCEEKEGSCSILKNGVVVKSKDEKEMIHYSCKDGYKPFTAPGWWAKTVCKEGKSQLKCIEKKQCRQRPKIPHAKEAHKDKMRVDCEDGYTLDPPGMTLKCESGEWNIPDTPICKPSSKECDAPPQAENAVVTKEQYQKKYLSGSEITYACKDKYNLAVNMHEKSWTITCKDGTWDPQEQPNCKVNKCQENPGICGQGQCSAAEGYTCTCDHGYQLNDRNTTCVEVIQPRTTKPTDPTTNTTVTQVSEQSTGIEKNLSTQIAE